ncbi:sialic acid-binding Ig-like lectin 13 [Dendropsophus ebraccatus]|uniref:sialic acid-binding Ig-like lectin 13 n=1 Tax=Dendropsophus ebraccatus TaxID=150705 RepID=UPI003831C55C
MGQIKPSSMWVRLVVILPLVWKGITCLAGYSIQVSPSVSVQEGLCVTIPCTFTANNTNTFRDSFGYWRRPPLHTGDIVATNDKSSDVKKPNFHLRGNPDTGDCTLTITDAGREDEGKYFFRFEGSKYSSVKYSYYREVTTTITVTDLTEEPVISDLGTVTAGIDKTVTCSPPGNCSATSLVIQWKKSDVSGIWKNTPTITFTPSLDDHQKTLTCEMITSKGKTTKKTILLDVCSPTSVTVTWEINGKKKNKADNKDIKVVEGSEMILTCSVQSIRTFNVTWTDWRNKVLQDGTEKELKLKLENMTMKDTGTYTCSALTDCVINGTNITINVLYPPRNMEITIQSDSGKKHPARSQVNINENETLTLTCRADGNPPSTVVWVRGAAGNETSITSNSGLSAEINVTSSQADVYQCLAWNGLGLRERRIQVAIKQDHLETPAEQTSSDKLSFWNLVIAFICGICISALVILLYKLITRKKNAKTETYMSVNGVSSSAEQQSTDDIYMNVDKPKQKAEEATYSDIKNASGATLDENELHYSTVAFTEKPSKGPSSQPETEYAEVKRK